MTDEEIFGHDMIRECLDGMGLRYLTDSDGDFVVQFAYQSDWDRALGFFFIVTGSSQMVFQIMVQSSKPCAQDQWDTALLFCNDWNTSRRWPCASVSLLDGESSVPPNIVLNESFPMPLPCPKDHVQSLIVLMIESAADFWRDAHARGI